MITMTVDVAPFAAALDDVSQRQIPFALSRAINNTLTDFQSVQRNFMARAFTLRQPAFAARAVKISGPDFATKARLSGAVHMEDPHGSGPSRGSIFTKFEAGGEQIAHDYYAPFIVPAASIWPDRTQLVPRYLFPKNLRLEDRKNVTGVLPFTSRKRKKGGVQRIGKYGTFVLDPEQDAVTRYMILQRIRQRDVNKAGEFHGKRAGAGYQGDTRVIWWYLLKRHIPARLHFVDNARETITTRFPVNFALWWGRALLTAK